jgi:anti-anti-sigma factor
MSLQISTRKSGDVTIVDLRGRSTLNDGESDQLSSRLGDLIANGARKLLLNLQDVTHIDSSGVSILVETYVSLKRRGGGLKLLCKHGRVLEVLTVFRLLESFGSFEDETEALTSFQSLAYVAKS